MMLIRTFVGASDIHGVGVFAGEPVEKGRVIWQFNPAIDVLIGEDERAGLPQIVRGFLERYAYPDADRPGVMVLNADDGRFMNHSDKPNTHFGDYDGTAIADIPEGEELTCDYREFYDPSFWSRHPFLR